jgi:ATP-dependent Clp protease ATP-binding subunit ClpB
MESLKSYFRPEFLNRLDEIITFDLLTPEVIADIVKIQVQDVIDRLEKKEIKLTLTKEVYDYLATEGYDARYGARPLKRLIQSKILTPVANNMVGEGMVQGGTVKVSMKKGKATTKNDQTPQEQELDFDIKKKGRTNLKKKSTTKAVTKKKREKVAA